MVFLVFSTALALDTSSVKSYSVREHEACLDGVKKWYQSGDELPSRADEAEKRVGKCGEFFVEEYARVSAELEQIAARMFELYPIATESSVAASKEEADKIREEYEWITSMRWRYAQRKQELTIILGANSAEATVYHNAASEQRFRACLGLIDLPREEYLEGMCESLPK